MGMTNDIPLEGFRGFDSWVGVLAWVALGAEMYYKTPLDLMPRRVRVELQGIRVRVSPLTGNSFDAFIADEGHRERFLAFDAAPSSDIEPEQVETKLDVKRSEPWLDNGG